MTIHHAFIESAPLYTRQGITNFLPPESITRMCDHEKCQKPTTWAKTGDVLRVEVSRFPTTGFHAVTYRCGLCRATILTVMYELLDWSEDPTSKVLPKMWRHTAVRKIGQTPPQQIDIPAELQHRLGSTCSHYKKALICREQGYGIAALAYMRRVVDEKTDELIEVMVNLSRSYNVSETEITKLLEVQTQVRFEDKLNAATELIPEAIRPHGVNPLGQLYKHSSIGLHGKSDDQCIVIFDDLKADFEYVFRNLHNQAKEHREYTERLKHRAVKKL